MSEPTLDDFNHKMKDLARELFRWASDQMEGQEWSEVVLEVRYAGDGSYLNKVRVNTPADPRKSLGDQPHRMLLLLMALDGMRRVFPKEWFSFTLAVSKAGQVEVKYGYDSGGVGDPRFFYD